MAEDGKQSLRGERLAARRAVPDDVRRMESRQICGHLPETVGNAQVVAAYVPIRTEPGSPEMLDVLAQLCETVLLPVVRTGPAGEPLPLQWGRYVAGQLSAARFGLTEPAGPALPASALAEAHVVLVPALAVDRRGVRLGRGGGFYDRSLPLCGPGTHLVAVVRDGDLVDELPREPHDVPMTHVLTPGGGLIPLHGGAST
jgi:5-formyltetrahydrofolate cyclo-ligase